MRGGDRDATGMPCCCQGRSPHARGRQDVGNYSLIGAGSIPACAGETRHAHRPLPDAGVDPRMRGGDRRQGRRRRGHQGRSPHARGRLHENAQWQGADGSIPACAGETTVAAFRDSALRVDPRMRGGDRKCQACVRACRGRSPHARGRRAEDAAVNLGIRSIPACAGETYGWRAPRRRHQVDPRMRGGDSHSFASINNGAGRSPHARGRRASQSRTSGLTGSIPACAGETGRCCS